jgi:hypothetical protein
VQEQLAALNTDLTLATEEHYLLTQELARISTTDLTLATAT